MCDLIVVLYKQLCALYFISECANGGTCMPGVGDVMTSQFHDTRCYCVAPWGGVDCTTQADPCSGERCSFRGDCRYDDNDDAHCECNDPRWSGEHCEFETCGSLTCQNGGSCV